MLTMLVVGIRVFRSHLDPLCASRRPAAAAGIVGLMVVETIATFVGSDPADDDPGRIRRGDASGGAQPDAVRLRRTRQPWRPAPGPARSLAHARCTLTPRPPERTRSGQSASRVSANGRTDAEASPSRSEWLLIHSASALKAGRVVLSKFRRPQFAGADRPGSCTSTRIHPRVLRDEVRSGTGTPLPAAAEVVLSLHALPLRHCPTSVTYHGTSAPEASARAWYRGTSNHPSSSPSGQLR